MRILSLLKVILTGLRCAYMVIPDCLRQTFLETANNVNLKIPLLNAEIISELIASGNAGRIIGQKKRQAKERNRIYKLVILIFLYRVSMALGNFQKN